VTLLEEISTSKEPIPLLYIPKGATRYSVGNGLVKSQLPLHRPSIVLVQVNEPFSSRRGWTEDQERYEILGTRTAPKTYLMGSGGALLFLTRDKDKSDIIEKASLGEGGEIFVNQDECE